MAHDSIIVTCLGDIAPVGAAESLLLENTRSHRKHFENLFAKSDIVFGNLESPLTTATTEAEDKKYLLRANHRVLEAFSEKFVFSIANNHILDYGQTGLLDTIDHLTQKGFHFTGAGKNLEAAGKPVVIDCKGKKIGLLAAADNRYPAATASTPGLFPASPGLLCPSIRSLRHKADFVYVSIHMGMEFIPVPSPSMINIAKQCHLAGAHVVFFHHAHCVSGHTASAGGATLWGTGNFLFPEMMPYPFNPWFETAAWHIRHPIGTKQTLEEINIKTEPFVLAHNGLPQKPGRSKGNEITDRIDSLGRIINKKKRLTWLRLTNMGKPVYIKLFIDNYSDIARRKGIRHMVGQIFSAITALFLHKKSAK